MTLKNKISFLISLVFSILFAIAAFIIFYLFSNFRKVEFESRLKEKAFSSIKLLVEVAQVDRQLLKIIDQNSINKLYDEKTLIFDSSYQLIYSSLDDAKIKWNVDDLKYLKVNKTFFKKENKYEVYGVFYDTNYKDYYALISASDDYGKRKLEYLFYTLLTTYIVFTGLCWFITFYSVKRLLLPLDNFHSKIKSINENNLDTRVEVKQSNNEIDLLGSEFNQMLQRIDLSYQKQKEFTAQASHELRTPVARVTSQLENRILDKQIDQKQQGFLKTILNDVNQITELISSLLLLSKLNDKSSQFNNTYRIDELIYASIDRLHKSHPEFRIKFNIEFSEELDTVLEVKGSKSLLEIAIINLLKNACVYSNNNQANILINQINSRLTVAISNDGKTLNAVEQQNLFQPFMRGANAKGKAGLGLGLRIVQRILNQHGASIIYHTPDEQTNIFIITFSH